MELSIDGPHLTADRQGGIPPIRPPDFGNLTTDELDRHIRVGWDDWCDLLEALVRTEGMLPPDDLACRVIRFFESRYWAAEGARIEALRRQSPSTKLIGSRGAEHSIGLR